MEEAILIRHAESYYNINESDDLDSDLTNRGIKQAEGVAWYLKDSQDADGFKGYVSPFRRTLETARAIRQATGINFKVFPLISEYGATWSKVPYQVFVPNRSQEYPEYDWSLYEQGQLFTAETFHQFVDRMHKVLKSELSEKTLLVSHGAVVYTVVDLLVGGNVIEEGYQQVTNASVSKIVGNKALYTFRNHWKEGWKNERESHDSFRN